MNKFNYDISKIDELELKLSFCMHNLFESYYSNSDLQSLINEVSYLLGRPVIIHDIKFKILASSKSADYTMTFNNSENENKYIKDEIIDYIIQNNIPSKVRRSGLSTYINPQDVLPGIIVSLVKVNEIEIAYLIVYENELKFSEFDFKLIEGFNKLLSIAFQNDNVINSYKNLIPNHILSDLLDGKLIDESLAREKIKNINLSSSNTLAIMVISDKLSTYLDTKIPSVIQAIRPFIPLDNCLIYKSDIVVFIDEKLAINLYKKILPYERLLEANNLNVGISLKFSKISDCKKYYMQAIEALKVGKKQNIHISHFKDSLLYIISNLITSKYDLIDFCDPDIITLMEYDKKNNTELLKTLKNYIYYLNTPNEASKNLCVHRNTMFYRINKIKDMTDIKLETGSEICTLYLSIRFLEVNGIVNLGDLPTKKRED